MAKYKFELKYGSNNAPIKVISFISMTCTYCAEFMLKDNNNFKKLANTGKVQFGFFPYLRDDRDELIFANIIASGSDQEKAYMAHAKFYSRLRPRSESAHYAMINAKSNKLGFAINDYPSLKSSNRIRSNLRTIDSIGRNVWKIKSLPASTINGYVMHNPSNGKLVRDLKKFAKRF